MQRLKTMQPRTQMLADLHQPDWRDRLASAADAHSSPAFLVEYAGRAIECRGTLIRSSAIDVSIGELCELRLSNGTSRVAEVVGLIEGGALLAPHDGIEGISAQTRIIPLRRGHRVAVGNSLLGRVLDGYGRPIDGGLPLESAQTAVIRQPPPNVMRRPTIRRTFDTGIKTIDTLLTLGRGQRIGVFAPAGVGKTTLSRMLLEAGNVDVCVVGLIGERGREVSEFVEQMSVSPAARRTVVVVATSDRSASERFNAGLVATTIAEAFRDRGAHALLVLDSVTRLARALREIGLANGEPPTRRGFPPTVFSELPRLLERAGTNEHGAITAIYNVLVEGDTNEDPIAEDVRSIVDGHIILSRRLAEQGHFPAIDVPASLSRLMPGLIDSAHRSGADKVRAMLARYEEVELLLQVGEYEKGADPLTDEAVEKHQRIKSFLAQSIGQRVAFETALKQLQELC